MIGISASALLRRTCSTSRCPAVSSWLRLTSSRSAHLPSQRSRKVLVYLDRIASCTRTVFEGMAAYAVQHGPWRFAPVPVPTRLMREAVGGHCDGVIARVMTPLMQRTLIASGVPVVNVGSIEPTTLPTVKLDDAEVGRIGARNLLGAELPAFGFCGVPWTWYSAPRARGFIETIAGASRPCFVFGLEPTFSLGPARRANQTRLDAWLAELPKPVGLMACDDVRAREVIEACGRLGLRVPDDVAIVGAGNDAMVCEITDPPLSSVAIAGDRVGFEAARLLAQLMDGQPPRAQPTIIPPVGVVSRCSTRAAFMDDADVAQAVEFIRHRAAEGITVEDVLRVVPLSRRALEIRFRHTLGRSPGEEIRRLRIERAKRMLVETDAAMAGVALASGFSSANQLCETFRREAGVSPTRYRRQFRAG